MNVMAITPASLITDPYTFFNSGLLMFTRASVATRVNAAGLIETVPADTASLDRDPITLAHKRFAQRGVPDKFDPKFNYRTLGRKVR